MRDRSKINKRMLAAACLLSALLLAGCARGGTEAGGTPETGAAEDSGTGFLLTGPGSYDSADTAVIVNIDSTAGTITFFNLEVSRNYTLEYDGTTVFSDKYGQPMSLEQFREGDIVDVTFLKSKKRLNTLMLSENGWINEEVSRYHIDAAAHNITIGENVYKITEDVKIFSGSEEIGMMDLNSTDILTFQGTGSTINSIVVEKGHGYLRLSGDENFIGGWIEVGQSIICQITEDMLLTVPEGSYQVLISITGGGGAKNVIINRNEEVTLDISDLVIEEPKIGQVVFALTPSTASLYVDGNLVDTSAPVSLEYGIHQLIARADGYSTVTSYLKVGEESAGIEITLDEENTDEGDEEDSSSEDTDGEDADGTDADGTDTGGTDTGGADTGGTSTGGTSTAVGYYQVYIDAPEGVEVYVDGNYVGISPVSFKKEEGAHVITLRRTGYETRSYTVQIDSEDRDVTYSFVELVAD